MNFIVQIIGITGSNGKTSTKDLVASVLAPYFNVRKTEGNFNNELGLPLTILSLDEDTEFAVLEMGMSGFGEISFLSKLAKPHYASHYKYWRSAYAGSRFTCGYCESEIRNY